MAMRTHFLHLQTRTCTFSSWHDKKCLPIISNKRVVIPSYQCQSLHWVAVSSHNSLHSCLKKEVHRFGHPIWQKTARVIKVLITLHIFMDTIKNKTAIKKIADTGVKGPKDPISSWSTWWTQWQADCFPAPIFGACEKWGRMLVCGPRWLINLPLSPLWC